MSSLPDLSTFAGNGAKLAASTRLGDELAAWIAEAIAGPDQITWDLGLTLIPTQAGPQPGYILLIRMPSPVLGEYLAHVVLVDLGGLTQPVIAHQVRDGVERLRQQRSALLAAPGGVA